MQKYFRQHACLNNQKFEMFLKFYQKMSLRHYDIFKIPQKMALRIYQKTFKRYLKILSFIRQVYNILWNNKMSFKHNVFLEFCIISFKSLFFSYYELSSILYYFLFYYKLMNKITKICKIIHVYEFDLISYIDSRFFQWIMVSIFVGSVCTSIVWLVSYHCHMSFPCLRSTILHMVFCFR